MIQISTIKSIGITNHAIQRAKIRARLVMNEVQRSNIREFLVLDFKRSSMDRKIEMIPFYRNKQWSSYGVNTYISYSKMFKFMWVLEDNRAVVKSVAYINN